MHKKSNTESLLTSTLQDFLSSENENLSYVFQKYYLFYEICCIYFLHAKETYVFYVDIKYVDKSKVNQNNCTAQVFLSNIIYHHYSEIFIEMNTNKTT